MADTLPDPDAEAADLIEALLAELDHDATVDTDLPSTWTPTDPAHVLVACDLIDATGTWPIYADCTIRATVYASGPRRAKRIALDLLGLLVDAGAQPPFARHRPLTGPLLTRDDANKADVASITVRSTLRTVPLVLPGS